MNELPVELRLYREQLRDAVARDLADARRRLAPPHVSPRLALPVGGAVVAAAIAATVVLISAGPQTQSAQAAILHRIAAALSPPSGTILHEQAQISTPGQAAQPFELWQQADAPHAYRVIKWGHEGGWSTSGYSNYDATANTITTDASTAQSRDAVDPATTLRSLVQSGQARIDGTTTLDGLRAYKLTVTSSPDPWLIGVAYVATSDYHPLEIDTVTNSEKIVYRAYEYLPATSTNMKLLDLAAQHPDARHVTVAPSRDRTTTTS